ncbi:MAG: YafY family transcriptional regulator [Clostridia bacterium]|nr:YafY family transcriptional regulator [Clostridia bacterium]
MKINRLLEITIILLNRESITARELSDRFGVSTRTIYRDIDILSSAGVPVFTNKGSGGGIALLENYSLNRTLVSDHEIDSLLLALKTLQAIKYPEIDMIIDKIGSVFKNTEAADWVYIDFSQWGSKPNEYNKFINIKRAVLERRVISFEYINAEGNKSLRSMEPMKLIFKGQAWYLWGFCKGRQDFRVFRISRIKKLLLTNEIFERKRPESVRKEESDGSQKPPVNLKLKFSPEVLYRIYDDFDEDMITRNEDGTYRVDIALPEDEWVYGYLMSFGYFLEVLEPKHIRKILTDRMKKTLKFYDN